jgi:hypothetical protein
MAKEAVPDPLMADKKPEVDPFIVKLEQALTDMLNEPLEPKDRNALFANAIKFLAIKLKMGGDDGGDFFGD